VRDAEVTVHYSLVGTLVGMEADSRQLIIAHDAIPGYMGAMTMPFRVQDAHELDGLRVGERVAGELSVTATDAWISGLRIAPDADQADAPLLKSVSRMETSNTMAHQLAIGDFAPAIGGIDERGGAWTLADFRGQVVAVTFIYTRCPLPTYCPLMSRNFALARTVLEKLVANRHEGFQFLSLSLDAAHDHAEVLSQYAKAFRVEDKGWLFATANEAQLRAFGDAVGLEFRATPSGMDHNLRTVVIDREGRVRKIFRGNGWTPQELVSEMLRAR